MYRKLESTRDMKQKDHILYPVLNVLCYIMIACILLRLNIFYMDFASLPINRILIYISIACEWYWHIVAHNCMH
jgi:hypothetical protein